MQHCMGAQSLSRVYRALSRRYAAKGSWKSNWIGNRDSFAQKSKDELSLIAKDLKTEAARLGLPLVGITPTAPSAHLESYEKWIEKGLHGEMKYMSRKDRLDRRRNPDLILPGAKSVIMVGLAYWPGRSGFPTEHSVPQDVKKGDGMGYNNSGIVSCYAWGQDYHDILQERLRKLGEWLHERAGGVMRYYVDTGAILERDFAERAGLGFAGKNTLLINPRIGSGFFIGALFSTLELPIDGEDVPNTGRGKPGCGKCKKCIVACPTKAIIEDHVVDARKCISYLTIELKGSIPEDLRADMGARIYGCDICQQVCPWNNMDWSSKQSPLFGMVGNKVHTPKLTELVEMNEAQFEKRYKDSAVYRIGLERLCRNVAVALGNVGGKDELGVVERIARSHSSELVREHARWAQNRIRQRIKNKAQNMQSRNESVPV